MIMYYVWERMNQVCCIHDNVLCVGEDEPSVLYT